MTVAENLCHVLCTHIYNWLRFTSDTATDTTGSGRIQLGTRNLTRCESHSSRPSASLTLLCPPPFTAYFARQAQVWGRRRAAGCETFAQSLSRVPFLLRPTRGINEERSNRMPCHSDIEREENKAGRTRARGEEHLHFVARCGIDRGNRHNGFPWYREEVSFLRLHPMDWCAGGRTHVERPKLEISHLRHR